ncbi:hypothetical protein BC831DRAFT_486488 [Entophlyctis helioformis]|nr:hypothetical protein BC831DRAFT_486488 [Entophlyctis helioformis]
MAKQEPGCSVGSLQTLIRVISTISVVIGIITIFVPANYSANIISGLASISLGMLGFIAASTPAHARVYNYTFLLFFFLDTAFAVFSVVLGIVNKSSIIDTCTDTTIDVSTSECERAYQMFLTLVIAVSVVRFIVQGVFAYYVNQYAQKAQALIAAERADAEHGLQPVVTAA